MVNMYVLIVLLGELAIIHPSFTISGSSRSTARTQHHGGYVMGIPREMMVWTMIRRTNWMENMETWTLYDTVRICKVSWITYDDWQMGDREIGGTPKKRISTVPLVNDSPVKAYQVRKSSEKWWPKMTRSQPTGWVGTHPWKKLNAIN